MQIISSRSRTAALTGTGFDCRRISTTWVRGSRSSESKRIAATADPTNRAVAYLRIASTPPWRGWRLAGQNLRFLNIHQFLKLEIGSVRVHASVANGMFLVKLLSREEPFQSGLQAVEETGRQRSDSRDDGHVRGIAGSQDCLFELLRSGFWKCLSE